MGIDRRKASRNAATTWAAMLGIALATVGAAALGQAQNRSPPAPQQQEQKQQQPKPGARPRQVPRSDSSKKGTEKEEPGGLRLPPAEELPGELADRPAADPLGPGDRNPMPGEAGQPAAPGADPNAMVVPQWPFVYEMTMASYDGSPLAIRYYPSQQGSSAPVVLLVHDLGPGRSGKDFDDPIKELDGQGLAGHLQQEGYAVFSLDLRGHGQSPSRIRGAEGRPSDARRPSSGVPVLDRPAQPSRIEPVEAGRGGPGRGGEPGDGLGFDPGAAVSIEGRTSDLAGLALISPRTEAGGRTLEPTISALAPRFPILLEAGKGDSNAASLAETLEPIIGRPAGEPVGDDRRPGCRPRT